MRSEFAAVAVAGVVTGSALLGATDAQAEPQQSHAGASFAIDIGGVPAGWIHSVEGGHATADVVTEKVGANTVQHKHLAGVKYEDIVVSAGAGMSKSFYEWIKASFDHKHVRKDGAIRVGDAQYKITDVVEFKSALISEVGFPALDAASKDAAKMTIKFSPEFTRFQKGSGKVEPATFALGKGEQKRWVPRNFRLDWAGCGEPCKNQLKISPVFVRIAPPAAKGVQGETQHKVSNVVVTMPVPVDLNKWSGDGRVRVGTLEYRGYDGAVLYAFKLADMKPVRVVIHAIGNKAHAEIEFAARGIDWVTQ